MGAWMDHHFWLTTFIGLLIVAMASEAWFVLLAYMIGSINIIDPRKRD